MRKFRTPARRRAKVFGHGQAIPLDRNAKARIWAYAQGYTARHRQPGQHRGPLTRATLDVLRALLWRFHNQHTGRCFPSYEAIAEAAQVNRCTVARAITALEEGQVLTWQNRLVRERIIEPGLIGPVARLVPRRTSNAYALLDPQATARRVCLSGLPKSQNPTGTRNQDLLPLSAGEQTAELDPDNPLEAALLQLRAAMQASQQPDGETARG